MPMYRIDRPDLDDSVGVLHVHMCGGRKMPLPCAAPCLPTDNAAMYRGKCCRPSEALCDAFVGTSVDGKPLTCDMPLCAHHRTPGGTNVDYCPRHVPLAPALLPLEPL